MLKVRKRAENLNFLSNSIVLLRQFFYSRDQFMALLRVNEMTIDTLNPCAYIIGITVILFMKCLIKHLINVPKV